MLLLLLLPPRKVRSSHRSYIFAVRSSTFSRLHIPLRLRALSMSASAALLPPESPPLTMSEMRIPALELPVVEVTGAAEVGGGGGGVLPSFLKGKFAGGLRVVSLVYVYALPPGVLGAPCV